MLVASEMIYADSWASTVESTAAAEASAGESDVAYESDDKDVWFDDGNLMDLDLTSDFDLEDRSYHCG
jgi:hypothetical protein